MTLIPNIIAPLIVSLKRFFMDSSNINSLFNLSGKVAIVTGAGDGIGEGCAKILAMAGASVVVSDISFEKAKRVADEIIAAGAKAVAIGCNVLSPADLKNTVEFAVKTFGTVNILINNAGLGGGGRENPFNIDDGYVERVYKVNLFAPLQLCKLTAPEMQKSGYGSIVNITSMSSVNKEANMSIYASSKAALNHLSANLAYDLGKMGIRINCVGPGATRTAALASILSPELQEKMLSHTPIRRLGEVGDVAQAVLFFASPASSWVSGQILYVNGGGVQTLD